MNVTKSSPAEKNQPSNEEILHLIVLFLILLIAVVIRLKYLTQPMRYDEAFSFLVFADQPLSVGLSFYPIANNHVFHTLLVHISTSLFGSQPWAIRLPAFLAGILLIPVTYLTFRKLFDKHTALLTAGLVATSSVFIEYSTNARGHTLLNTFFLLMLYFGCRIIQDKNRRDIVFFAVFSALGFYTVPTMIYSFSTVVIWLFFAIIRQEKGAERLALFKSLGIALIAAAIISLILYLPVFINTGIKVFFRSYTMERLSMSKFIRELFFSLKTTLHLWNRDVPLIIRVLFLCGFLVSLVFHQRLTSYRLPIFLVATLWLFPLMFISQVVPPSRHWLFLLLIYLGMAASGINYVIDRSLALPRDSFKPVIQAGLAITLTVFLAGNVITRQSIYDSTETATLKDAEAIIKFLKSNLKAPDRILVFSPSDAPLRYYARQYDIPESNWFFDWEAFKNPHLPGPFPTKDLDSCKRFLVVVNKAHKQKYAAVFTDILYRSGMLSELMKLKLSAPKYLRRYASADLYQIDVSR